LEFVYFSHSDNDSLKCLPHTQGAVPITPFTLRSILQAWSGSWLEVYTYTSSILQLQH